MREITYQDIVNWLPIRPLDAYKGTMGRVLCVGGNENMGGAIIMAASACVYAGAGITTVASHSNNLHALHARLPEAMFINFTQNDLLEAEVARAETILLGPGLGRDSQGLGIMKRVLASVGDQTLVLDADALNLLADYNIALPDTRIIATPHRGEWLRLTGDDLSRSTSQDRLGLAQDLGMWVVLKGVETEVYLDNQVYYNQGGNPSMATGGMGDVLGGIIAGLLGQYPNSQQAVLSGVYLHAYIADHLARDHYVTLPTQIISHIPYYMQSIVRDKLKEEQ